MKVRMILAGVALALTAQAQAGGDVEAGKAKAATCAACHGGNGIAAIPLYPNLAGQKAPYLVKQLKAFRDGTRADPVMGPMTKPLSDEDIANLSAYFASLPAGG
ncbi:c-type cytochrome [Gallaecimonas sp. GXIMD4217]|uniref:c-type cytochrome n=1 Tax=Gallaecimonas sp. GXIMD4217 TaxID=3131927 RepID=UPI00311B1178